MLPTKYTSKDTNVHMLFYSPLIAEITQLDFCYFRVEVKLLWLHLRQLAIWEEVESD